MNGLDLLIGMTIVSLIGFICNKIAIYKQKAKFWKDSCYTVMEMYNDMLVKQSVNSAIDKIADKNRDHVN